MIELSAVSKFFGEVEAVRGVSLSVAVGQALGIAGPSGSGKTTLLRLIAGLERPDGGEIYIDGARASGLGWLLPPHRRGIGFAFQEPALWPHLNVAQNILFGVRDCGGAEARERLAELLAAVELQGYERRRPVQLSAGQARRVGLARALAPKPRILLMDEPLTNLEDELKERMLALIARWQRDAGSTLVYVAHAPDEVRRITSRVLRLVDGQLA